MIEHKDKIDYLEYEVKKKIFFFFKFFLYKFFF